MIHKNGFLISVVVLLSFCASSSYAVAVDVESPIKDSVDKLRINPDTINGVMPEKQR